MRSGVDITRAATIEAVALGILLSVIGSGTLAHESHVPQSGGVKGQVVADIPEKRRPLVGVVMHLSGERLPDKKMQVVSDEEGRYNFSGLTAADYVVSVELQGFKKYEQKISVQIEATVELNILLHPVALSETVTVTDDKMVRIPTPPSTVNSPARSRPLKRARAATIGAIW